MVVVIKPSLAVHNWECINASGIKYGLPLFKMFWTLTIAYIDGSRVWRNQLHRVGGTCACADDNRHTARRPSGKHRLFARITGYSEERNRSVGDRNTADWPDWNNHQWTRCDAERRSAPATHHKECNFINGRKQGPKILGAGFEGIKLITSYMLPYCLLVSLCISMILKDFSFPAHAQWVSSNVGAWPSCEVLWLSSCMMGSCCSRSELTNDRTNARANLIQVTDTGDSETDLLNEGGQPAVADSLQDQLSEMTSTRSLGLSTHEFAGLWQRESFDYVYGIGKRPKILGVRV